MSPAWRRGITGRVKRRGGDVSVAFLGADGIIKSVHLCVDCVTCHVIV
jgi:hypothetical protein